VPADSWQPVSGVLARIDLTNIPEPERSHLQQRLAKYVNAPFTNSLMSQIRNDLSDLSGGQRGPASWTWRTDAPGSFSLMIGQPPETPAVTQAVQSAPQPAFPSDGVNQIRVGAGVQAHKATRTVPPVYPPLAQQARIQGIVRFNVQIARDGTVKTMQLVSGHPMLVEAAKQALAQYEYAPTLLNGEPVQVVTTVDVNFTLE
jgi:TonB family protein